MSLAAVPRLLTGRTPLEWTFVARSRVPIGAFGKCLETDERCSCPTNLARQTACHADEMTAIIVARDGSE